MPSLDPAIEAVKKAEHLSEETRRVYSSKLGVIAKAAGNQPPLKVLSHCPNKVIQYITKSYTEIASQKTMLVSIMAVYRLLNIKVKAKGNCSQNPAEACRALLCDTFIRVSWTVRT